MRKGWGRGRWLPAAVAAVAVLLVAAGSAGLAGADDGVRRERASAAGVPLWVVRPAGAGTGLPGVVVVHGFAGSGRLMLGFADTLARHGYLVVLPDLAGHGANPDALTAAAGRPGADLDDDLAAAVGYLRSRPDADPGRVGLVGHSMGAAAVVRYAAAHPDVAATVAISLGDAGAAATADRPRNLLLVVGAAEFARVREAALTAVRAVEPAAGWDTRVGDVAAGTARRAVRVAGTEHVAVLYAERTHVDTAAWLDAALRPAAPAAQPQPRRRLVPAGLLLLGLALGLVPLAAALLGRPGGPDRDRAPTGPVPAGGSARRRAPGGGARGAPRWALPAGLTAGVLLAVALAGVAPTARLPLAVGGYVVGFLVLFAGGLLAVDRWAARRVRTCGAVAAAYPAVGRRGGEAGPVDSVGRRRLAVAAALLVGYAVVAVTIPVHAGLTSAVPVGARWWLLPLVCAGWGVFFWAAERLARGAWAAHAALLAVTVVALLAAAVAGAAPGFVVLVVPLLVVLLVWQAAWAAVLRRRAAPAWLVAAVGAVLLGWPVATTLPLV